MKVGYNTGEVRQFVSMFLVGACLNCFLLVSAFGGVQSPSVRVPSSILAMNPSGSTAIVVEKSTQMLFLYKYDGKYSLVHKFRCSTGKLDGRKMKSGDQKTPEGVYFFTGKYFEKDLSPIYGALAIPTDYPNQIDVAQGLTGSAIWLHGTNKILKPRDSNGCVALEDKNIVSVGNKISLDHTPIIITENLSLISWKENKHFISKIDAFLDQWVKTTTGGTYHEYLALYSPDFAPDISWWNKWRAARTEKGNTNPRFSFDLRSRAIYKDKDIFVVLFDEIIKSGSLEKRVGVRKLYIGEKEGEFKISGDNYKILHAAKKTGSEKNLNTYPLLASVSDLSRIAREASVVKTKRNVKDLLRQWVEAWSTGNMEQYGSCYADGFISSGMDKNAWLDRKRYLSKVYNYIDIQISEPVIEMGEGDVLVSFLQNYKSSGYSAAGMKTLVLVNEEKQWKIIQEIWKKN